MRIKKNRHYKWTTSILWAISSIAISSCFNKVEWTGPEFDQKPVVSSIIKSGKPITVQVSLAVAYNTKTTAAVDNAVIMLFVENEYAETLAHIDAGIYQSELVAQEGKEYRCELTVPGYPTAICSTRIPNHRNILSFEHIKKAGVDEEGLTFPAVKVSFENNPDQLLYYEIVIYLFEESDTSRPKLLDFTEPVLLNEGLPLAVFSNSLIDSDSCTITINYSTGRATNHNNTGWVTILYPVQVELRTVNEAYYKFIKQQYLYELSTGKPIFSVGATSSFNLFSNVENGYGVFAGYSSVKSGIIYP